MTKVRRSVAWVILIGLGVVAASAVRAPQGAGAQAPGTVQVAANAIGGTVTNAASGQPEAGVWVLAETNLPTPYR
jgi:hypothetical protein